LLLFIEVSYQASLWVLEALRVVNISHLLFTDNTLVFCGG